MSEKEKDLLPDEAENDTVSGDIENTEPETEETAEISESAGGEEASDTVEQAAEEEAADEACKGEKKARAPMSKRTKKRLLAVGIAAASILLALAILLISVSILNNRPPKLEDVKARFEELLSASQEVNEIIWGAGLPVYKRVESKTQTVEVDVIKENGEPVTNKEGVPQKKTVRYYLYEDAELGTLVSYEYQVRVSAGETTEVETNGKIETVNVYTVYDVEFGRVLPEYENGASRFAQKTKTAVEGKTPIFEKDGYYYYALPGYENEEIAAAALLYDGQEDEHYDYVRPDCVYKNTDQLRERISGVYSGVYTAQIFENLFTGMVGAVNDAHQPAYTDYIEEGSTWEYLMKSNASGAWRDVLPVAVFDFSTMQIVGGNAKKVTVTVSYRIAGDETVRVMEVDFVLENGAWYLNTPTFA